MAGYPDSPTPAQRAVWETLHDANPDRRLSVAELANAAHVSTGTAGAALRMMHGLGHVHYWTQERKDAPPVRLWWLTRAGRRACEQVLRRYAAGS